MGVLGLIPFLQRHCPNVIKILPSRLKELQGKTVIIDGTLITQRLHWAPSPYKYRHVLGWYRLVTELQTSGVNAVCVFDGVERSAAKASELERRKLQRQMVTARSLIETERHSRLRKLSRLLDTIQSISETERATAIKSIQTLITQRSLSQYNLPKDARNFLDSDPLASIDAITNSNSITLDCYSDTQNTLNLVEHHGRVEHDTFSPVADDLLDSDIAVDEEYPGAPVTIALPSLALPEDHDFLKIRSDDYRVVRDPYIHERPRTEEISMLLYNLYQQYQQSARSRPSLINHHLPQDSKLTSINEDGEDIIQESKVQQLMSLQEGKLWEAVVSVTSLSDNDAASKAISELADRSYTLAQSYQKRSQPPTVDTYRESRAMLNAMGVPMIETAGSFEAEGLAASLVIHGLGDYVATEDTDVLVYGAPMLRNLTSHSRPLVLISGSNVRDALQLSREGFIDFALLLGTDFSRRIRNVGPSRALKFIRTHQQIEIIVALEPQYAPPPGVDRDAYLAQVELARNVFNSLPPIPDNLDIRQKDRDSRKVSALLSQFGLARIVADEKDWDNGAALAGNYFNESNVFK